MKKKGLIDKADRRLEVGLNKFDRKVKGTLKRLDEKLGTGGK